MIRIDTKENFPGILNPEIKSGFLTEEKPFVFISGSYTQNLTDTQYKKLKGYAAKENKEDKENEKTELKEKELTGLELLKSKYDALKDKKSSEAANLRKQIKDLEEQEKKGSK